MGADFGFLCSGVLAVVVPNAKYITHYYYYQAFDKGLIKIKFAYLCLQVRFAAVSRPVLALGRGVAVAETIGLVVAVTG